MSDPDAHSALQQDRDWRTAVWSLRVGYLGLAVGIGGLIAMFAGSTPWVLAAGVIIWLVAAGFTLAEFFRARNGLPDPRPGFWSMRFMLIHDSVHRRGSVTERA